MLLQWIDGSNEYGAAATVARQGLRHNFSFFSAYCEDQTIVGEVAFLWIYVLTSRRASGVFFHALSQWAAKPFRFLAQ